MDDSVDVAMFPGMVVAINRMGNCNERQFDNMYGYSIQGRDVVIRLDDKTEIRFYGGLKTTLRCQTTALVTFELEASESITVRNKTLVPVSGNTILFMLSVGG